jgi:FKBP-type peptidyl-prolyl cis-trans isomerase FklB
MRSATIALVSLLGVLLAPRPVPAEEAGLDFEDDTTRISYSLGYQIGGDFKRQGVEMNADAVVRGIEDALAGADPKMTTEEMLAMLMALKKQVTENQEATQRQSELQIIDEGKAFLDANAGKEGIMTTESGLQYRIIDAGAGRKPGPEDRVTVNYAGTLINGNPFDSGEGVTFPLNGVIKGWTEGLQLIGEGGHIELFIPAELAYNRRGPLAHRTLIFDVKLLAIEDAAE